MQLPSFITRALSFFETSEAHQKKVESALASASTAQAEVARLTVDLAARDATISGHAAALADFDGRVAAEVATKTAALAKEKADAEAKAGTAEKALADLIANPSAQAQRILASHGSAPVPKTKTDSTEKTMTVSEFNALDHKARNEFMRDGGKLANA